MTNGQMRLQLRVDGMPHGRVRSGQQTLDVNPIQKPTRR